MERDPYLHKWSLGPKTTQRMVIKQAFLDKTAHIQDMIAQETGSEIMDLLDQAKAAYAG